MFIDMTSRSLSYIERLRGKTTYSPSGCWLWEGASNGSAGGGRYGVMLYHGKMRGTHVVSYIEHYGPLPEGKTQVHHKCETKLCWRPDHLEATTPRENQLATPGTWVYKAAHQTHCKRGHEFTPANTYAKSIHGGKRIVRECRACQKVRRQERKLSVV